MNNWGSEAGLFTSLHYVYRNPWDAGSLFTFRLIKTQIIFLMPLVNQVFLKKQTNKKNCSSWSPLVASKRQNCINEINHHLIFFVWLVIFNLIFAVQETLTLASVCKWTMQKKADPFLLSPAIVWHPKGVT